MKKTHLLKFVPPDETKPRVANVKFRPASDAELKALGDALPDGYIAGWASTKEMDLYRHRITPGAFQEAITTRGLTGPRGIKLLANHNWEQLSGVIKKLEYRNGDLWIEAQLNLAISYVRDIYLAAKDMGGLSFSVGFMLEKYGIEVDEEDETGEWLRIDKGDLYEVSVVPFPANEAATMDFIKSANGAPGVTDYETQVSASEFEKLLVLSGIAKSRRDSNRMVQDAKAKGISFRKGAAAPVVVPPPEPTTPVLALEQLHAMAGLVAKMKQTLHGG